MNAIESRRRNQTRHPECQDTREPDDNGQVCQNALRPSPQDGLEQLEEELGFVTVASPVDFFRRVSCSRLGSAP